MALDDVAGRAYARVYRVSGRGDLLDFLVDAVQQSGGRVLYASDPKRAPVYLGVQGVHEERIGLLVYPFRATHNVTRNRPRDEHRVQIRYGSERSWADDHPVGRDVAGVDTTVVLGVHLAADVLVRLDGPKSGFWLEWKRKGLDPDASLLQAYTHVLAEARPRRFLLENVYALTYDNSASRPAYERLLREIDTAGYQFRAKVLNAADYGVPQARPRGFVIGVPKGEPLPAHPAPTHGGAWERRHTGHANTPHVTTGQALAGMTTDPEPEEIVRGQYAGLLPAIPPGDNYLHYTAKHGHPEPRFEWRSRYWSFLLKLDPTRPSPTIQAQPGPNVGPFHWDNRRLRVPEIKRVFTFPDGFDLVGRRASVQASVQAQLGNSVPPCSPRQ